MTLSLFGHTAPWRRLLDDGPILSGRHPLHLYHGYLGAAALREHGRLCCYDPAFQAGYPKTPVFDGECRLAELFLSVAGGDYRPGAYKVGLALCCLSIPVLLILAARGAGLGGGSTCLATAAALLVCWGAPGRAALHGGDIDLLMAALAGLLQFGLLVRFDRDPGLACWLGLLLSGCLGWLAGPLLFAALFPAVLLYYLGVGPRHRSLGWHAGLLVGLAGGVAVNSIWLIDWVRNWWIRSPLPLGEALLPHRTFHTLWNASLWGGPFDRGLALALVGGALLGVLLLNQTGHRPAARLLGMGTGGLFTLTVLGIAAEPLGQLGTARLLVPALWFAALPAAHVLGQGLRLAGGLNHPGRVAALGGALLLGAVVAAPDSLASLAAHLAGTTPLEIGPGPGRQRLLGTLAAVTGPEARVLWEDTPGRRWASLLPLWTGRSFLGGLDPDAGIDHAYAGFNDRRLAGRHILHWTDEQLDEFCRRYNVGWVVCWSEASRKRFGAWPAAQPAAELRDGEPGWVFRIRRPFSFALQGKAQLLHADSQHITLADVVPEDGVVVLSLHYHRKLRASPSRVQIEREPDANDPIPFIRLRVTGPVARVTLTWED
jgi:hypothetical protein